MGVEMPTTGRQIIILALSAILMSCAPVWASTWENVTVVTVDGWEYPGMTVTGAMGQDVLVMVGEGGGRRKLPRARIRLILDADGRDITQAVLTAPGDGTVDPSDLESNSESGAPSPGAESLPTIENPPPSGSEATPRPLRNLGPRSRFRISPSLGFGYSQSSGEWFSGMTSGTAIDGKVRIMFSDEAFMVLSYRRQSLGVDSSLNNLYDMQVEWDVTLGEYFVGVGRTAHPKNLTSPFGYGELGIGIIVHDLSVSIGGGSGYSDAQIASLSTSESKLGLSFEGGVLVPISTNVAIDLSVNGRMTGNGEGGSQESFGFLFGGRAGVAILMGND